MLKFLYWVVFCLVGASVYSQNQYTLAGKVVDESGSLIPVGDVLLYDANEVSMVMYAQLFDGKFRLEGLSENNYNLQVSVLGYQEYIKEIKLNKNRQLHIVLKEDATKLEGVEVIAAKSPITNRNGNLKIDVQHPVFSAIPDPLDVLSKLPNVQVSPDSESISIIGKGNPLIYLGGQRISFEEFTALSVDNIAHIELINNPTSKYEAEGRAVLLVTRKSKSKKGTKVNIGETVSFKRNYNNYLNTNGSHSNGKWNLQSNLAFNDLGHWESNSFAFRIPEQNIFSDYLVLIPQGNRKQLNGGLGFFLPLKKDDYVSFNTTFKLQTDKAQIETATFLKSGAGEDVILTETANEQTKDYFSGNFNFNKKVASDINLFTGLQYSSFKQTLDTDIANNFNENGFSLDQIREQSYRINSLAFRLDVEYDVSSKLKWEFGTNWNEARANAFTEIQEISNPDKASVDFDYKERFYSGYTSLSGNLKKGLDYNAGMRVEYSQVQSQIENEMSPLPDRSNTKAFPKANLSFKLDSTKTVSVNYARSISRPNFSRTSTITTFINPFLEATNNVNLLPTLTSELSANFQWKNTSVNASYYRNTNPIYWTISFDEAINKAILSPINLDMESGFHVGFTLPFSHKKWTSTNNINISYNKIMDKTAVGGATKPSLYAYSSQQLTIGRDTTIAFGGWLLTKRQEGIFKRNSMLVLDMTITKTLFKKLHCAIRLNDITKAMNFEERYAIDGVEAEGVYFADAKEVAFSMKYVFGNTKDTAFKNRDIDENLQRIN